MHLSSNRILLAFITSLALAACSKAPIPATQAPHQTYPVRGVLQAINFAEQTAMIEHEEIPDYMPAMTMPFDVKSIAEIAPFSAGDRLEFTLVVTDTTSWIERIKRIGTGKVQAAPAASSEPRLKEGDTIPAFRLTDDQGREITGETYAGQPLLMTFIFTRCPIPNFCPLMSRNFAAIRSAIADDEVLTGQTRFLSVSFDSEFDTPAVLHQYARLHTQEHDVWRFASGKAAEVDKLTQAFSVYVQREGGTFSHGLCTALIGPDGVIRRIWRGNNWEASEAVTALRDLRPALISVAQNE
jgi:protein SCO1/2